MKSIIKASLIILLLAITMHGVYGLGVTPARTTIGFEPGLHKEITLRILNNQNKDMNVVVLKRGELSEYVTLGNELIGFTSEEREKLFGYIVDLPQQIEKPGEHDVEIMLVEVPFSTTEKEAATAVGGRASVISQLRINVPYPGAYAEAELYISPLDDKVVFTIPVFNLGTHDLNIRANIRIYGPENKRVADINAANVEIKAKKNGKITAEWEPKYAGYYKAVVMLYYSNKVIEIERNFDVGSILIKLEGIVFGKFELGSIVKFDIILQSEWNGDIKEVYAELSVEDKKGDSVAAMKTASADIAPLSKQKLTAYWDTKGISVGLYDVIIKLNYAGKISEERIEVNVMEDSISTTAEIIRPSPVKTKAIIIIASVLTIIALIAVFVYSRRKAHK